MTAQQKAKKLTARREAADKLTSAERLRALAEESHGLARIVAKNPSTLISLLRDLSRSEDEATRKSVISNPRAPYDVLSNLELQFSELSVNNPALQFYNSLKPQFVGITLHIVGVCINRIGTHQMFDSWSVWIATQIVSLAKSGLFPGGACVTVRLLGGLWRPTGISW